MNLKDLSTLQIALGLSVIAHAALLTVRFVDPESFNRVFKETPLEVILVNSKTRDRPDPGAKLMAQTTLAGGGDLEKQVRATSPLPPSEFRALGDATEDAQKQVEAMQAQQMQLLTQIKQQLAAMPVPDPRNQGNPAENAAREEKRKQLVNLLAEIERRVNEENARPKKRYVSPSTRETAFAVYVDTMLRRVEARAAVNFPELAGKKLYGELKITMTINFDGNVLATVVDQSSGNIALDRRAEAIIRSTGNFGKFTVAMRREQADQLVIQGTFRFARDGTMEITQ